MVPKAHFLTYANDNILYAQHAEKYCDSALEAGFESATFYAENDLRKTPFWDANASILTQKRGAGFWLWKPYIIRDHLIRLSTDEVLIYSDAGRGLISQVTYFNGFPTNIVMLAAALRQGYLVGLATNWGVQARFTKRRCFQLMDADTDEMHNAPQIQATWSVWRNTPEARVFLDQWLEYCRDPRILMDDAENDVGQDLPDFQSHRHDQAIGSILAHRHKAPFLKLYEKANKLILNEIRRELDLKSDLYKRINSVEKLLRVRFPDGISSTTSAADLATVAAHADGDEPTPDLSLARLGTRPLERVNAYLEKARSGKIGEIDWLEFWAVMSPDAKLGVKALCKGKKKPEVLALHDALLQTHKDQLAASPTRAISKGEAKASITALLQPMLEAREIYIPGFYWSQMAIGLQPEVMHQMRSLFGRLPKANVDALRARWSLDFRTLSSRATQDSDSDMAQRFLLEKIAEAYSGIPSDDPAMRWRALWCRLDQNRRRAWMRLCKGRQLHICINYEDQMLALLEGVRVADESGAFDAGLVGLRDAG